MGRSGRARGRVVWLVLQVIRTFGIAPDNSVRVLGLIIGNSVEHLISGVGGFVGCWLGWGRWSERCFRRRSDIARIRGDSRLGESAHLSVVGFRRSGKAYAARIGDLSGARRRNWVAGLDFFTSQSRSSSGSGELWPGSEPGPLKASQITCAIILKSSQRLQFST